MTVRKHTYKAPSCHNLIGKGKSDDHDAHDDALRMYSKGGAALSLRKREMACRTGSLGAQARQSTTQVHSPNVSPITPAATPFIFMFSPTNRERRLMSLTKSSEMPDILGLRHAHPDISFAISPGQPYGKAAALPAAGSRHAR